MDPFNKRQGLLHLQSAADEASIPLLRTGLDVVRRHADHHASGGAVGGYALVALRPVSALGHVRHWGAAGTGGGGTGGAVEEFALGVAGDDVVDLRAHVRRQGGRATSVAVGNLVGVAAGEDVVQFGCRYRVALGGEHRLAAAAGFEDAVGDPAVGDLVDRGLQHLVAGIDLRVDANLTVVDGVGARSGFQCHGAAGEAVEDCQGRIENAHR